MSYAGILAIVTGAGDDTLTLTVAAGMSRQARGEVRTILVLSALLEGQRWSAAGVYLPPDMAEANRRANDAARRHVEATIQDLTVAEGLELDDDGGRFVLLDEQATALLSLRGETPVTDLVVAGRSTLEELGVWTGLIEGALYQARLPLLVVNRTMAENPIAAIAWNGGDAAGRAVRAALPFLVNAPRVVILQDPHNIPASGPTHDAADPQRLVRYLKLHGVSEVDVISREGVSREDGLVRAAHQAGAELLVAGAFEHHRLTEDLFGGRTARLLEDASPCNILLAH